MNKCCDLTTENRKVDKVVGFRKKHNIKCGVA